MTDDLRGSCVWLCGSDVTADPVMERVNECAAEAVLSIVLEHGEPGQFVIGGPRRSDGADRPDGL